jgi:hypothetical protein
MVWNQSYMERFSKWRDDRHRICSFGIRVKSKFHYWVWGGAGFDGDYREINYYVQYQKNNLSIALWDLFNTTGIANGI